MVNRRDTLKVAAGIALGSQFGTALAAEQETTTVGQEDLSGIFLAGATGGQVVEPVDTEAQGAAVFAVSEGGNSVDYAVAVQNIENVTMTHIHMAPPGENGPVVAWLYPEDAQQPDPISGEFDGMLASGTIEMGDLVGPLEGESIDALVEAMADGETYVQAHTEENPGGVIRGHILSVTEAVEELGLEQQATTTAEEETTTA